MAYIDYYQVFGVDKTASQDDIKKAFCKLARKFMSCAVSWVCSDDICCGLVNSSVSLLSDR